jgi:homogentisate 1,2-dioxygenase
MPQYTRVGKPPQKRHSVATGEAGRLAEELMGQYGFSGASSLLYHLHSPSALLSAEAFDLARPALQMNKALEPCHLRLGQIPTGGDPVTGRTVILGNAELSLCWVSADTSSDLYRNAEGDELAYVLEGSGQLESVFGALQFGQGDYLVVPASTTHRWVIDPGTRLELLVIEAAGHIGPPARYMTDTGQMKEGAPFSERDLRGPADPILRDGTDVPVIVRHKAGWARHVYENHPFDVVAWDGCVYPYAFSIHDFEPIVGRVHQPPPIHQTFAGPGFVVCSFVPRLLDFGDSQVKVPYHHANTDSDEVLFYADGDFTSRSGTGIAKRSVTLHPAGFVHGPQPGSYEASVDAVHTNETAVMVDTFSPLGISPAARGVADPTYLRSWSTARREH